MSDDKITIAITPETPKGFDWHFHYDGPVDPAEDYDCVTCLAGKRKRCPTHGTPDAGCAHCRAAAGHPCQAHWGIRAAFAAHESCVSERSKSDYAAARALVESELASAGRAVSVDMRGSGSLEDTGSREFFVAVHKR